jgi:inosine-uridine nucleoside N-ribohydrolase
VKPSRRSFVRTLGCGLGALGGSGLHPVFCQQEPLRERLKLPSGRVNIVLDTDTYNEVDDQFALAYALLSPDAMRVEAVHAAPFTNSRSKDPGDGMEKSYQEIHRVLDVLGDGAGPQYPNKDRDRFVYRGSDRYFPAPGKPVESPAARDLIRRALMPRETPLYVVAVGAPTNVSSALLLEPRIRDKIVVVWLGAQPYTMKSAREFNCRQDVPASQTLFDSGVALINIPARNVSEHLRTTLPELERHLKGHSKIGDYLYRIVAEYERERSPRKGYPWSKVIWDISAIALLIRPEWVRTEVVPSPILTDQITWEHDPARHPVRVATGLDRDAIFDDLFRKFAAS